MEFLETSIRGAYLITPNRKFDDRGFFARVWCESEFEAQGLSSRIAQANTGLSHKAGTLRGIHFQLAPAAESKLVRCTKGAIFDVVVDLRKDSPSHCRWAAYELSDCNGQMLYVPEGCGHGYQTLADDTEILYMTSRPYSPDLARGVRFDDPAFRIDWPRSVSVISESDRTWPNYRP